LSTDALGYDFLWDAWRWRRFIRDSRLFGTAIFYSLNKLLFFYPT